MKIELWLIAKNESYVTEGITMFEKRIGRYVQFSIKYFEGDRKGKTPELIKAAEAKAILAKLELRDHLVILDERGKSYSSKEFASLINGFLSAGAKKVVFLIGGAYGVDESLTSRANLLLSLSEMTFSHQVARFVFVEQLYRAFTIINREPYHHG